MNHRLRLGPSVILLAFLFSCSATRDVPSDDHCKEAGYSIANRTLTCTGDPDLANARYEAYDAEYRCLSTEVSEPAYQCAVLLRELSCEDVARYGDSIDAWLYELPECTAIVARDDGEKPVQPCGVDQTRCGETCHYLQTDAFHCGTCDNECPADGEKRPRCVEGVCEVSSCPRETLDCDADPDTCETENYTVENCGACGVACPDRPNATAICDEPGCTFFCGSEWADCDGDVANGCETAVNTPQSCGECGVSCSAEEGAPYNQVPACTNGKCDFVCKSGYADCGGAPETCETNINEDLNHCGGCNQPCAGTCVDGVCS